MGKMYLLRYRPILLSPAQLPGKGITAVHVGGTHAWTVYAGDSHAQAVHVGCTRMDRAHPRMGNGLQHARFGAGVPSLTG